jgi:hypothetical protein
MTEERFEAPSPHEELVAHHATHDRLAQRIALVTAILATIGAVLSYQSGANQNLAMFLKNESIRKQTQASDQWAYYQASSIKQHIAENIAVITSDEQQRAKLLARAQHEASKKADIRQAAQRLQLQSQAFNVRSDQVLRPHERMALGMTLIQIAVALASITVLTRRTWLFWGSMLSALAGVAVAASGLM